MPGSVHSSVRLFFCLIGLWLPGAVAASTSNTLTVGVLQFGTVRWELDVIQRHQLGQQQNLEIRVVPLASNQATLTALQSGAVDMIVGDWIWAAKQRQFNRHYAFFPYSNAVASLYVADDSDIKSFADLRGKRIGVAGGPVNKSWVLYKAYAKKEFDFDLMGDAQIKFAAPPILNKLMMKSELDAVINFWHFGARLEAAGYRTLVDIETVFSAFDITAQAPVLGWLFKKQWAEANADALNRFLAVSYQARSKLLQDDAEWERLQPLENFENDTLRTLLREGYRQGIPRRSGMAERDATQRLFSVLRSEAGDDLTGSLTQLPDNLFWTSSVLPAQ